MIKNITYILIVIIFIVAYLRHFEHRMLYFPTREIEFTPEIINLSYEDIYFSTEDNVKLNAWFLPAKDSKFTLLFCHGNGGNICHRIEKIRALNALGLDVFIFDYRGYGKSDGRPSEQGFYRDISAAYEYLVSEKKISPDRIVLYGESLGGAVAIDLAARVHVKALITEATFSSTKDVARVVFPYFPVFLISSKFDSLNKIKNIKAPKLIIHSQNDEIIPFVQSEKLFNAAPEPKKRLILIGPHNSCYIDSKERYFAGIKDFLNSI